MWIHGHQIVWKSTWFLMGAAMGLDGGDDGSVCRAKMKATAAMGTDVVLPSPASVAGDEEDRWIQENAHTRTQWNTSDLCRQPTRRFLTLLLYINRRKTYHDSTHTMSSDFIASSHDREHAVRHDTYDSTGNAKRTASHCINSASIRLYNDAPEIAKIGH